MWVQLLPAPVYAAPYVAAAGVGGRHQQPMPAQIDACASAAISTGAAALGMSRMHDRRSRFIGRGAEALARHATPTAAQQPNASNVSNAWQAINEHVLQAAAKHAIT
jgi:hypothetical protein